MKLLHIDSSPLAGNSVSRQLTERVVAQWRAFHPGTVVEYLDLAVDAPNHLNIDSLGFRTGPNAADLSDVQRRENEISERLVSQFLAADVIVVGAPMYNFSIPTQLKAWIDRIAVAGKTFSYTENGPVGLVKGKRAIIALARGGFYNEASPAASLEHVETYLRGLFNFIGVEPEFVIAEGLNISPEHREAALGTAIGETVRLAA